MSSARSVKVDEGKNRDKTPSSDVNNRKAVDLSGSSDDDRDSEDEKAVDDDSDWEDDDEVDNESNRISAFQRIDNDRFPKSRCSELTKGLKQHAATKHKVPTTPNNQHERPRSTASEKELKKLAKEEKISLTQDKVRRPYLKESGSPNQRDWFGDWFGESNSIF
ncbi:MAG: hypothetical protein M1835_006934 [Candelina submexicana]|nr:MAG: hypothetical protein M1835_006934 [Candelina submexicana]